MDSWDPTLHVIGVIIKLIVAYKLISVSYTILVRSTYFKYYFSRINEINLVRNLFSRNVLLTR